jgi:hypothetical protein
MLQLPLPQEPCGRHSIAGRILWPPENDKASSEILAGFSPKAPPLVPAAMQGGGENCWVADGNLATW